MLSQLKPNKYEEVSVRRGNNLLFNYKMPTAANKPIVPRKDRPFKKFHSEKVTMLTNINRYMQNIYHSLTLSPILFIWWVTWHLVVNQPTHTRMNWLADMEYNSNHTNIQPVIRSRMVMTFKFNLPGQFSHGPEIDCCLRQMFLHSKPTAVGIDGNIVQMCVFFLTINANFHKRNACFFFIVVRFH